MTEWRRELKSWPKETPQTADPLSLPEWVVEAGRERSKALGAKRAARRWNAFFLFGVLPYVFVASLLPSGPLSWGMLGGAFVAGAISLTLAVRSLDRAAVRRRDGSLERAAKAGEPTLGAEFVGVDYAEGSWTYPGLGTSADEGLLRIDMDRLMFVGRDTRFELPADAILGTELRRVETGLGTYPRLALRWAHGGESGTVGLSLPPHGSRRRRVQDARDLRERIERWRGEPLVRRSASAILPPTMAPTKKPDMMACVGRPAKTIAGGLIFGAWIGLFALAEFALLVTGHRDWARHLGGTTGLLWIPALMSWTVLAAKIEPRLPERYRYRKAEDVRDALRNVEPVAEAAVEVRSNA